jgi:hypothetical protein
MTQGHAGPLQKPAGSAAQDSLGQHRPGDHRDHRDFRFLRLDFSWNEGTAVPALKLLKRNCFRRGPLSPHGSAFRFLSTDMKTGDSVSKSMG